VGDDRKYVENILINDKKLKVDKHDLKKKNVLLKKQIRGEIVKINVVADYYVTYNYLYPNPKLDITSGSSTVTYAYYDKEDKLKALYVYLYLSVPDPLKQEK
jgi:hypothetical protein